MGSCIVAANNESANGGVEFAERQARGRDGLAAQETAGKVRQQLGVDGPEEALDLPAPLGTGNGGVHEAHAQVRGYLRDMGAGEVGPMIDIEHVRDAADRPVRIALAPDCLAQRERGVQRRGRVSRL